MGTVCRKTSQRKERLSWHLPLRPLLPLSLRLMPMPTTATAMVLATTVLATTVWATGPTATTARGRLRLRLIPTTTVATDGGLTDTVLVAITVATTESVRLRPSPTTVSTLPTMLLPQLSPATPRSHPPPPSPPLALPPPPSLLLEEPTLVPAATSPTPPEPSMLPRGRLRPTPTTTE